ncbi:MAG: triose-phosphate isomerase [Candidatus Shapirobacteria bacterium]
MILVNFKIYKESFGKGAIELAKICQEVAKKTGIEIIPVVSALDAYRIKNELKIKVLIQHVDNYADGAKTGFISPFQAKELDLNGSLVNHSEHKLKPGTIKSMLKNWPDKFESILCLNSLNQANGWARSLKPTMVAYEPSELIGSKDKSVASEKPQVIKKMVEKFAPIPVLVGAGVKSVEDIKISLKLGAKGVLIASGIVTAKDPKSELLKLATAFGV